MSSRSDVLLWARRVTGMKKVTPHQLLEIAPDAGLDAAQEAFHKIARMAHPEYAGISGRTRIKQIFSPTPGRLEVWFPPKWGLNATLSKSSDRASDLFGRTAAHGLR